MFKNGKKLFRYALTIIIVSLTFLCGSLQICEATSTSSKAGISFTESEVNQSDEKIVETDSSQKKLPQTNDISSLFLFTLGVIIILLVANLIKKSCDNNT